MVGLIEGGGTTGGYQYSPLSDVSGLSTNVDYATQNTSAINNALATKKIVSINTAGTYYINTPLILKNGGNQMLFLGEGVEIKLAPNSNCNMVRTWALNNGTQKTITSITANDWEGNGSLPSKGTQVICTAVCTNHGFSVGQKVSIMWSGSRGFGGVFYVETVADANTFTYKPRIKPSAQTAPGVSGQTKYAILADENIIIQGPGKFNADVANNGALLSDSAGWLIHLAHYDNVQIDRVRFTNNGGRDVMFYAGNNLRITNYKGVNGHVSLQCLGPISNTFIDGVESVNYSDDGIALVLREDNAFPSLQLSEGDIFGFKVRNTDIDSPTAIIPIYFFTNLYIMAGIDFDDIGGKTAGTAIKATSTVISGPLLQGVCKDMRLGNITASGAVSIFVSDNITYDVLEFSGLKYKTPVINSMIFFGSSNIIHKLIVNKFDCLGMHNPPATDFLFMFACAVETMVFRDCYYDNSSGSGNGYMIGFTTGGSFVEMIIENISGSGGWFCQIPSLITSGKIVVNGMHSQGGLLQFDILGTCDIEHNGVVLSGATRFLNIRSTGVVTARGNEPTLGGAVYAAITAGGSLIPKSFGVPISAVATGVSVASGNMLRHTGATNPGPAVANGTVYYAIAQGAAGVNAQCS